MSRLGRLADKKRPYPSEFMRPQRFRKASRVSEAKIPRRSTEPCFKNRAKQSPIALFGAILLSAAGSLPLHLIPLIVVALTIDGRVSVVGAGWVGSAILLGQLSSSLALPMLKVSVVHRISAFCAVFLLLLGLTITTLAGSISLYLGWCLVGSSCGVLMYLGTVSASHYRRTTFAFSLRLGVVLILAGSTAGGLVGSNALVSYQSFLTTLFLIFGLICAVGLMLYSPTTHDVRVATQGQHHHWHAPQMLGLLALFILFVGQTGFLAYVVQGAVNRGMTLAESTWAIATMKILAGLWLVIVANLRLQTEKKPRFLEFGALLAVGVAIASYTVVPVIFFLSLLSFEIAFNTLSARFQAKVAETNRLLAGLWLTATILLGAACGPPLHGAAIDAGVTYYFLLLAICSAVFPAIWAKAYTT